MISDGVDCIGWERVVCGGREKILCCRNKNGAYVLTSIVGTDVGNIFST